MLIKIPGGVLYYSVLYCGDQNGITSQPATCIADRGGSGRKWPASSYRHAELQFRLPRPQLRLKQQQLRLTTVIGTGER